jgi:hypothetical protein
MLRFVAYDSFSGIMKITAKATIPLHLVYGKILNAPTLHILIRLQL